MSAASFTPVVRQFRVPDELMAQLHDATTRFSSAKRHLDEELQFIDPNHAHRAHMTGELRDADQQLEKVRTQIATFFRENAGLPN